MNLLRILLIALFMSIMALKPAFCADDFRIKNLLIDNSDRLILIQGQGNYKNNQTMTYIPVPGGNGDRINLINDITTFTISSPTRFVLDIPNAILEGANRSFKIENSTVLSNIQLAQFSAKPNIVRVVFTLLNKDDLNKFKIYTNGTNIIVKYVPEIIDNSLHYKFYTPTGDMWKNAKPQNTSAILTYNNTNETKSLIPRFQTKYYLSQISQNSDGLILRGIGTLSYQRVEYNPENTKATFILDNTTMASKLDDKTYRIPSSQRDIKGYLTINKLNARKVKVTLDGENIRDYRLVVSPDGQSLFVAHRSFIINTIFSQNPVNIKNYKFASTDAGYKVFELLFDKSVTYDVFEYNNNFYLDINNLGEYNEELLKETLKTSNLNIQALKISTDKTRFIIPMNEVNFAYANVESNAKSIKLCFKDKPLTIASTTPAVEIKEAPKPTEQPIIIATSNKEDKKEEVLNNEKINVIYIPKEETPKIEKPKKPKERPTISSMKKVVIDAGHGGLDSGAIGGGVYEKTLNLQVAKMVQEKLMKKDIYVYMTRTQDDTMSLEDRVNYSNEINPDLFISIHTNSTVQEDTYGLETHYFKEDSFELARVMHNNFASEKNLRKWDTKDRGVIKSRFYVINHTEAPSILIEMGFISNLDERARLLKKGYREDIATSIANGILEYLRKND